jgi:glyoxylase-like metal-dependent hydrolase (beta-lactamase superfamily II)
MSRSRDQALALLLSLAAAFALPSPVRADPPSVPAEPSGLRLYTLDCGRVTSADMHLFADTGEYDGRPLVMPDPCFLIRHPKGDLLWDAGLGDRVAAMKDGLPMLPGFVGTVSVTLRSQLQQLGLDYDQIGYFAFSHAHGDHLGNSNALLNATWILNEKDLAWVHRPGDRDAELISNYTQVKTKLIHLDYDVFGDQSVVILQTPGHTPGHQSLLLHLPHSGYVLLSGDLWHTRENYEGSRVPQVNSSRAETLASMDRIHRIMDRLHPRLVIQHDLVDFQGMPKFPAFLD